MHPFHELVESREKEGIFTGRITCIPLSVGLGWAYAGMNISWTIIIWVIVAITLQLLSERAFINYCSHEAHDG